MIVPITYELGEWLFRKYTTVESIEEIGWMSAKKANKLLLDNCEYKSEADRKSAEKLVKEMSKYLNRVKVGQGKAVRYYYKDDELIAYSIYLTHKNEEGLSNAVIGTQLKVQGYMSEYVVKINLHRLFTKENIKIYIADPNFIDFELEYIRVHVKSVCVGENHKIWYYSQKELNSYLKDRLIQLKEG